MNKILTNDERKIALFLVVFLVIGIVLFHTKELWVQEEIKETADSLRKIVEKSATIRKYDINKIDIETMEKLPGVGPKTAKLIFDYRQEKGEFSSLVELTNIKGIGKKTLGKMLPYLVYINDSTKVIEFLKTSDKKRTKRIKPAQIQSKPSIEQKININQAQVEVLKLLPSIGEIRAKKIIAYREKNGNFQSIEHIKNVSGIGEGIFNKIKKYITVDSVKVKK